MTKHSQDDTLTLASIGIDIGKDVFHTGKRMTFTHRGEQWLDDWMIVAAFAAHRLRGDPRDWKLLI